MRMLFLAGAVVGACTSSAPAAAQDWPNRPLTMVIPTAAGGDADILGRILASLAAVAATVVAPERRSPEYLRGFVVSEIEKWRARSRRAAL